MTTSGPASSESKDPDNFLQVLEPGWWRTDAIPDLNDILRTINRVRLAASKVDAFDQFMSELGTVTGGELLQGTLLRMRESGHALEESMEHLFDHPSRRLAAYGSLRPGESNAHQMNGIEGTWLHGTIPGIIEQPTEYLEFNWIPESPPVAVMVMSAFNLPQHYRRLDQFEGPDYVRTWVPVTIAGVVQVCNTYEGRCDLRQQK